MSGRHVGVEDVSDPGPACPDCDQLEMLGGALIEAMLEGLGRLPGTARFRAIDVVLDALTELGIEYTPRAE